MTRVAPQAKCAVGQIPDESSGRPATLLRLQSRSLPFVFGGTAATCLLVWVSACNSDSAVLPQRLRARDLGSGDVQVRDRLPKRRALFRSIGPARLRARDQDFDLLVASDDGLNDRAPHVAAYGADRLIGAWETSTAKGHLTRNDKSRKLHLRAFDSATGVAEGAAIQVDVKGNRYHEMVSFPDGSVAFVAPGSSATKLKILRVLPCGG